MPPDNQVHFEIFEEIWVKEVTLACVMNSFEPILMNHQNVIICRVDSFKCYSTKLKQLIELVVLYITDSVDSDPSSPLEKY